MCICTYIYVHIHHRLHIYIHTVWLSLNVLSTKYDVNGVYSHTRGDMCSVTSYTVAAIASVDP